jgi:hypothetical protein
MKTNGVTEGRREGGLTVRACACCMASANSGDSAIFCISRWKAGSAIWGGREGGREGG